ncbi:TetR/AcrR family transcriptional regulator [Virgibacillus sediminis]|uniref:TetR/AcrR family transcriptional regulator n=1 Tax=Virgibacillus sediminis TaxID=202260 RepID=A0ABV7A4U9_9BACI
MNTNTKSLIIENATALFQKKGYMGVGISEILRTCGITKGALYHHFPNGKEELLIACLESLNKTITTDVEAFFQKYPSTEEALEAMIEKLVADFERDGTITGYTFASIVSEMGSLNEPVREACSDLYTRIQGIYADKLMGDGFSQGDADSISLMLTASIEGGVMLCLTKDTSEPLKQISQVLPKTVLIT